MLMQNAKRWTVTGIAGAMSLAAVGLANAQDVTAKPHAGGIALQAPATEFMADLVWLDNMLLVIITGIVLFVTALLAYVVFKFNAKANPNPSRVTHNALLEVAWTGVPVLILIVIAIPSLRLLDKDMTIPETELTIKATGNQWYWDYEYADQGVSMSAIMLQRDELAEYGYEPDEYLLATDTRLVVPVNTNIHLLVTAGDVIHNWAMPSFGIKTDAIPGRINEAWFNVNEVGTYFGQCSELCGMQHAYMPIVVEVVSKEDYADWMASEVAKLTGMTDVADASAAVE
jgi:cytochrome c oxidase subunit 2